MVEINHKPRPLMKGSTTYHLCEEVASF